MHLIGGTFGRLSDELARTSAWDWPRKRKEFAYEVRDLENRFAGLSRTNETDLHHLEGLWHSTYMAATRLDGITERIDPQLTAMFDAVRHAPASRWAEAYSSQLFDTVFGYTDAVSHAALELREEMSKLARASISMAKRLVEQAIEDEKQTAGG